MVPRNNRMNKCVHIVTTLELGGAQQNTVFTVRNLQNFKGILITGAEGIIETPDVETYRTRFLVRSINPLLDVAAFFRIFALLKKIKPAVVHTHSSKAGIIGRWAAHFAGVPVIIHTFHGFGFNDRQRPFVRNLFIRLEKMTARITTHLFAVSRPNAGKAVELGICAGEKISVMHSGIDMKKWESHSSRDKAKRAFGISPGVPVVGTVSCLKPQKAPLDFVDVAGVIKRSRPDVRFIIVGDGALRPEVEKRIHKYRLGDNFILAGWRKDIEDVLPAFDINVLTSYWEGLPRVSLEAGVCMIPQVLSDVDGNSEIITDGETGYLVKPGDIAGFAEKILSLIDGPEKGRIFAHRLKKKLVGDFDIKNMAALIEAEYSRLLKQKTA